MTVPKTKPAPVTTAVKSASIPKRPVIQHTKLLTATLQAELRKASGALQEADMSLSLALQEMKDAIALATQKFDVIQAQVNEERQDIIASIDGLEAALKSMAPKPDNVVSIAQGEGK